MKLQSLQEVQGVYHKVCIKKEREEKIAKKLQFAIKKYRVACIYFRRISVLNVLVSGSSAVLSQNKAYLSPLNQI